MTQNFHPQNSTDSKQNTNHSFIEDWVAILVAFILGMIVATCLFFALYYSVATALGL